MQETYRYSRDTPRPVPAIALRGDAYTKALERVSAEGPLAVKRFLDTQRKARRLSIERVKAPVRRKILARYVYDEPIGPVPRVYRRRGIITPEKVIKACVCYFGFSARELRANDRRHEKRRARIVAWYLINYLGLESCAAIGRRMGGKDHTSILHGVHTVRQAVSDGDDSALKDIRAVCKRLRVSPSELTPPSALRSHGWTEFEDARLRKLRSEGLTYQQIADQMPGRSFYSCKWRGCVLGQVS